MTSLLVIGRNGQLAKALQHHGNVRGYAVQNTGHEDLDLADPSSVQAGLKALKPDAIINAAAYTAVDQAEEEEDLAHRINADSAAELAAFAKTLNIPFLHVSTDYVFDGEKQAPYLETDQTGPTGAYGRSKLAGEHMVVDANPDAHIFRTAWVYSATGKNFLKTMLKVGETRDTLNVVDDQIGNPTDACDLAAGLLDVTERMIHRDTLSDTAGIYHMAGSGDTSWADFADAIFDAAQNFGHPRPTVNRIPTSEYPTPTKRPSNSRLDCDKLYSVFGVRLPRWSESVPRTVETYYTIAQS